MKRFGQKHPKGQCDGKARYRDVNEAQFEIDRAEAASRGNAACVHLPPVRRRAPDINEPSGIPEG
jgi:hypothetical protein